MSVLFIESQVKLKEDNHPSYVQHTNYKISYFYSYRRILEKKQEDLEQNELDILGKEKEFVK